MLPVPGCVGADAELRYVDYNGESTPVLNFRMAYNRYPKKGEKQNPLWISVSVWGKKAETLATMLTKGKYVIAYGWLDLKTREQRDGNIAEITINANEVLLQGVGQQSAGSGNTRAAAAPSRPPTARIPTELDDPDIPF